MPRRKGPIKIPDDEDSYGDVQVNDVPADVLMPPLHVLDAGVLEFRRWLRFHWPAQTAGVSKAFDITNERELRYALGLTYKAMKLADNG